MPHPYMPSVRGDVVPVLGEVQMNYRPLSQAEREKIQREQRKSKHFWRRLAVRAIRLVRGIPW
jgi:hypothetical protein